MNYPDHNLSVNLTRNDIRLTQKIVQAEVPIPE